MSYIQSPEFLLYQIGLSFGLPAEKKKKDVEKLSARRGTKSEKISKAAIDAIAEAFELDENALRDLEDNLQKHLPLYLDLEAGIWTVGADQKLVDWTLANHVYIPVIARMMAFWYLDERSDIGMPDGKFWYLPEYESGPDSDFRLPVANVINWLLDLLGATPDGLVERRSDELRDAKIYTGIFDSNEEGDLAQALYKWKSSKSLPKLATIDKYFPDGMRDSFSDALKLDLDLKLDEQVGKVLEFCRSRRNKLTPEVLLGEIDMRASGSPLNGRLTAVFEGTANDKENALFIFQMVRRYQPPTPQTVRQRLKLARASQDIYIRCKKYFTEAKTQQLIELYKHVYNLTIGAEPKRNGSPEMIWLEANKNFTNSLKSLRFGVLSLFENFEEKLAPAFLKNRITRIFVEANVNTVLPDFFSPEGTQRDVEWCKQEVTLEDTLNWYAKALDRRSIRLEVETLDDIWGLLRIARDTQIDATIKRAATEKLDTLTQGTRLSGIGINVRLEIARNEGDETAIDNIRSQVLGAKADHAHTPHLYTQLGIHALTACDFESAQEYFLHALRIGKGNISGDMRGELSLHLWSLRRHMDHRPNSGQEEVWEKDIKMFAFETDEIFRNPPIGDWYSWWRRAYLE